MFRFFKKSNTPRDIAESTYTDTIGIFSELNIVQTLAMMHREALTTGISAEDGNDLVMGAYRTLFLAAGLAKYRVVREMQDEKVGDAIAKKVLDESSLRNIVDLIRGSVQFTSPEPMFEVSKESGILFQAASLFDRMLRQKQLGAAYEIWRECAKGSYTTLPLIVARAGTSH